MIEHSYGGVSWKHEDKEESSRCTAPEKSPRTFVKMYKNKVVQRIFNILGIVCLKKGGEQEIKISNHNCF